MMLISNVVEENESDQKMNPREVAVIKCKFKCCHQEKWNN